MENIIKSHVNNFIALIKPHTCLLLDNASAEILHWTVDCANLFEKGVKEIKVLSSFTQVPDNADSLFFLIQDPITGTNFSKILDVLKTAGKVAHVDIVTAFSENFHSSIQQNYTLNLETFDKIKLQIRRVLHDCRSVNIHHIPFFTCIIDSSLKLFVAPSLDDSFDMQLVKDLTSKDGQSTTSLIETVPVKQQLIIRQFCGNFWRLMTDMGLNFGLYSVGKLSRVVCEHLATIGIPKSATERCSVIFVDRVLDLVGTLQSMDKCFADQLFKSFHSLSRGSSDVRISLNEIFLKHVKTPICLANCAAGDNYKNLLTKAFTAKQKEIQNLTYRQLIDICSKEDVALPAKISKPSYENVCKVLSVLEKNRPVVRKHLSFISITAAVWLSCRKSQDNLKLKFEKMILQQLNSETNSPSELLLQFINDGSLKLTCDQLFPLLISSLSLAGDSPGRSNEVFAGVKLFEALKKYPDRNCPNCSTSNKSITCQEIMSTMTCDKDKFLNLISKISCARKHLSEFSQLFLVEDTVPQYRPLLQQVADAVFENDPTRPLNDLHYSTASSIKGLIKSGFSYFMPVSKPRPAECTTVIFFVIGGISPAEVKLVKESATKYSSQCNLYIGSNRLSGHPRETIASLIDVV